MPHPLALVIGVGPGIGLAVARRFAQGGFRVALVAQQEERLEAFKAAVGGTEVHAFAADVRDAQALGRALDRVREAAGEPHVLIYNASLGPAAPASQLPSEDLAEAFRVNVLGALESARRVIPALRAAGKGSLLFTGGGLALAPQAREASLSIGKAGLRALALCLAEELEPEGIHVATVTVAGFVNGVRAIA